MGSRPATEPACAWGRRCRCARSAPWRQGAATGAGLPSALCACWLVKSLCCRASQAGCSPQEQRGHESVGDVRWPVPDLRERRSLGQAQASIRTCPRPAQPRVGGVRTLNPAWVRGGACSVEAGLAVLYWQPTFLVHRAEESSPGGRCLARAPAKVGWPSRQAQASRRAFPPRRCTITVSLHPERLVLPLLCCQSSTHPAPAPAPHTSPPPHLSTPAQLCGGGRAAACDGYRPRRGGAQGGGCCGAEWVGWGVRVGGQVGTQRGCAAHASRQHAPQPVLITLLELPWLVLPRRPWRRRASPRTPSVRACAASSALTAAPDHRPRRPWRRRASPRTTSTCLRSTRLSPRRWVPCEEGWVGGSGG